jgi:ligand-binding sensor domain-containing protein
MFLLNRITFPIIKTLVFLLVLRVSIAPAQQFNLIPFNVEEGLPQSTVYDILQDREGYLWIGTDGGGVCRYDGFRFSGSDHSDPARVWRQIR